MKRAQLKEQAKRKLRGRWLEESGVALFMIGVGPFIGWFASSIGLSNGSDFLAMIALSLLQFLVIPFIFGYARRRIKHARGDDSDVSELFFYFQAEYFTLTTLLYLVMQVKVMLWSLLFILPGIIASYRYALVVYLKVDYPEAPIEQLLKASSNLMKGHKMDYFILNLSFMGWRILAALTLLGVFPLYVYESATRVEFYDSIHKDIGKTNKRGDEDE